MTRGLYDRETVALLLIAAVLPVAVTWLWFGGGAALLRLGAALLVFGAWHGVFMLARAQPPSLAGIICALAVAMLAPEGLGPGQVILGISFGAVLGELVFGGWGRNVVNPATATLAFLGFGFPAAPWPVIDLPVIWAALPAAALGLVFGILPVALLGGALLVGAAALFAGLAPPALAGPAALVLVLLVADPVASAATGLGRWLNGALYAALMLVFASGWQGAAPLQMAVSAALLVSLAAPLLDEIAIALWIARRRRLHGDT